MTNKLPENYIQTFSDLKDRIKKAQYQSLVAVNSEMILAYLDIGKVISERTQLGWGTSVIEKLSRDLQTEFVGMSGLSERSLYRMRLIYENLEKNQISPQLVAKLPWSHTELIFSKLKNKEQQVFYLQKSSEQAWSREVLKEKIQFDLYSKVLNFQNNFETTLSLSEESEYRLQFADEYDLSFLNLADRHTERQLENAIVLNITKTLGQFGSDFAFMGQQFRLELDGKEYFIDLLFYHRKLKSMIALELKVTEFKPEYSQQLNWYLHLLDKTVKYSEDNPSIGILLCKSKSKITVEYALELVNKPMGIATYSYTQLPLEIAKNLPSEEEFRILLSENL